MKQGLWNLTFTCTALCIIQPALAQTLFEQPREFVIDQPCDAHTSLKKQTNPTPLTTGNTYSALGENRQPDATHAFIRVDTDNKWVALSCGHYADGLPSPQPAPPTTAGNTASQCLPFFDNENNPVKVSVGGLVDITPPAPTLDAFDLAVNATCGAAGKVVAPDEFKSLLRNHPDVLQRIQAFTGNRVFADRPAAASTETYLQDLTDAWFNLKAFDHIFCGEPEAGHAIGGLHFHGRYLQLQASGEACRMNNYRQNEVVPGVLYSMGVKMKAANGGYAQSSIKGYGLTLSAEDLLKAVTRAFVENPTTSNESSACLLPLTDDKVDFSTVFVRRSNGIRTFYPDATPDTSEKRCTSAISITG